MMHQFMVDCGANCAQATLIESIQTKLSQKPRFSFAKMPTPQKITAIVVTQPAPVVNLIKHHLPEKKPYPFGTVQIVGHSAIHHGDPNQRWSIKAS